MFVRKQFLLSEMVPGDEDTNKITKLFAKTAYV